MTDLRRVQFGPFTFDPEMRSLSIPGPPQKFRWIISEPQLATLQLLLANKDGFESVHELSVRLYREDTAKNRMKIRRHIQGLRHHMDILISGSGLRYLVTKMSKGYRIVCESQEANVA